MEDKIIITFTQELLDEWTDIYMKKHPRTKLMLKTREIEINKTLKKEETKKENKAKKKTTNKKTKKK